MIKLDDQYMDVLRQMLEKYGFCCNVCAFSSGAEVPATRIVIAASENSGTLLVICETCWSHITDQHFQGN